MPAVTCNRISQFCTDACQRRPAMKRTASIAISILIVMSTSTARAQTQEPAVTAEAQKEAKQQVQKKALEMLETLLKELGTLRLTENRIRVESTAADLLWKRDEKRARALFERAVQELGTLAAVDDDQEPISSGELNDRAMSMQIR